ncbi:MAG: hypothetical protein ACI87H_003022, partial [Gammaproteobacteria bacterium]
FTDSADRGVTGHLPEGVDIVGEQKRAHTHARSGKRSLGTGMTTTNNNHFKSFAKVHERQFKQKGTHFSAQRASFQNLMIDLLQLPITQLN